MQKLKYLVDFGFTSGFVCSQVLFVVKTLRQSNSAGEVREKTFGIQFRLFREKFGPVLQKEAICLGLAPFLLFEGDGPLSCSRWEVLLKTQVTCLTVRKHAFVFCYWNLVTFATSKKSLKYSSTQTDLRV